MAEKSKDPDRAAYVAGHITKEEYEACVKGDAWVELGYIIPSNLSVPDSISGGPEQLYPGRAEMIKMEQLMGV